MSFYSSVTSTVAITQTPVNPLTGSFGTGKAVWFAASGTWTVPAGITAVRVRAWGAGADGGGGGGFAFKQTIGVTPGQSVTVTVGTPGGSATSVLGLTANNGTVGAGGTATGGDINNSGGLGGAGNLLGPGDVTSGVGGYGDSSPTSGINAVVVGASQTTISESAPGILTSFDFVGTGPGGRGGSTKPAGHGSNGGQGGGQNQATSYAGNGGFPGGGGGQAFSGGIYNGKGAKGLVIIEY